MSNEVGTPVNTDVAVPQRLGLEEPVDQRDLIIPMAKLFQGTPTEQEEYPDAKAGQIVNSLTKEIVPAEFIPCFKWTEVVKFNGRKKDDPLYDPSFEPGALIWKCTDPADARWKEGDWGTDGSVPTATRMMKFMCYFPGQNMPLILTFARTSYKVGKRLLSLVQFSGGDIFDRKYKLGTKKEQSDGNTFHVFTIDPAGITAPADHKVARQLYTDLRGKAAAAQHDAGFSE